MTLGNLIHLRRTLAFVQELEAKLRDLPAYWATWSAASELVEALERTIRAAEHEYCPPGGGAGI